MEWHVWEDADKLQVVALYNTDLFEATTIERMLGHYRQLLQGIVADPVQRVSQLPLLQANERRQLLVDWNDTRTPYPPEQSIPELFEAQVARTPQAVAVVFGQEQLDYAQLNARANQLAHHLRSLGVGPESRVGVCLGRSLEMVVALLGILKAGGAYVPLDPSYPAERLAFMLDDAIRVCLVLLHPAVASRCAWQSSKEMVVCLDQDEPSRLPVSRQTTRPASPTQGIWPT